MLTTVLSFIAQQFQISIHSSLPHALFNIGVPRFDLSIFLLFFGSHFRHSFFSYAIATNYSIVSINNFCTDNLSLISSSFIVFIIAYLLTGQSPKCHFHRILLFTYCACVYFFNSVCHVTFHKR